ncbi:non-homologous end-joining factor 1 isoform X1 [Takifugu rubripes]|uniref:Non-homologous end-joining factor 1 n=1 Tax=Takifugu rubripes TaxID=31033 RepID=A0A3B5KCB5_TAKRU|nr:non-homologous end-joining factor 1 isoform X1 [Takifugu rubripes]XP_029695560.1 non-homologous end-joining factor 1 isoform X1 [Takifugu rubripes]
MEAGEAASEVLLQLPWLPMNISGCQLLTKSWFGETTYHLLLTDTHCVWEERAGSLDIQKRAQELNRRLRAPVEAFFTHLCQVARPCLSGSDSQSDGGAQISLIRQDDGNLRVKLKSELAGLPFYWEFHCSLSPVTVACAQLVRPLLAMNHLLQRQVMDLEDLLVRKDAEIQDYKENGASLSRERLQTSVFEEQTFRNDFMAKTLPLLSSDQQLVLNFHADLQNLYAAVVQHSNSRRRKRKLSEEERPAAEDADVSPQAVAEGVTTTETGEDKQQRQSPQADAEESKMADRTPTKQVPLLPSDPAERASSKPKKKKVGLFR